jgi:hypothetical protein
VWLKIGFARNTRLASAFMDFGGIKKLMGKRARMSTPRDALNIAVLETRADLDVRKVKIAVIFTRLSVNSLLPNGYVLMKTVPLSM